MKETIFLYVSKGGVERMRKTFGEYKRGEIPIKLHLEVADDAFQPPVLEQYVHVEDWRDDIMVEDINLDRHTITGEEARLIREKRLEKAKELLEGEGYQVVESVEGDLDEE